MSKQHYKEIAERMIRAEDNFAASVARITGCDIEAAHKVTAYYLKHKIAKMDAPSARISVKHGVYLDRDVLENALAAVA